MREPNNSYSQTLHRAHTFLPYPYC